MSGRVESRGNLAFWRSQYHALLTIWEFKRQSARQNAPQPVRTQQLTSQPRRPPIAFRRQQPAGATRASAPQPLPGPVPQQRLATDWRLPLTADPRYIANSMQHVTYTEGPAPQIPPQRVPPNVIQPQPPAAQPSPLSGLEPARTARRGVNEWLSNPRNSFDNPPPYAPYSDITSVIQNDPAPAPPLARNPAAHPAAANPAAASVIPVGIVAEKIRQFGGQRGSVA